ncbi:hypothetical protein CABS03_13341 [Colletotrichum abscissum]|uniref:Uncharacterized protein n=2 Tax=Colletotrichum acutatum species complex TaxID=2707335 RepID=A0A9Q0B6X9_9PEZI|nr:hypothetical protein CABS02_02109 [Colletotrichum abscissum]
MLPFPARAQKIQSRPPQEEPTPT